MITFTEWPVVINAVGWSKRAWGYAQRGAIIAARVATLESRVATLEETLTKQPGDTCPYSGGRTMRMIKATDIMGDERNPWRQETWKCAECEQTDEKFRRY